MPFVEPLNTHEPHPTSIALLTSLQMKFYDPLHHRSCDLPAPPSATTRTSTYYSRLPKLVTKFGNSTRHHCFRSFPHVTETFVLAVGNSELKYSINSMYFYIVFFAVPFHIH